MLESNDPFCRLLKVWGWSIAAFTAIGSANVGSGTYVGSVCHRYVCNSHAVFLLGRHYHLCAAMQPFHSSFFSLSEQHTSHAIIIWSSQLHGLFYVSFHLASKEPSYSQATPFALSCLLLPPAPHLIFVVLLILPGHAQRAYQSNRTGHTACLRASERAFCQRASTTRIERDQVTGQLAI